MGHRGKRVVISVGLGPTDFLPQPVGLRCSPDFSLPALWAAGDWQKKWASLSRPARYFRFEEDLYHAKRFRYSLARINALTISASWKLPLWSLSFFSQKLKPLRSESAPSSGLRCR